jgi:hypothetical protein
MYQLLKLQSIEVIGKGGGGVASLLAGSPSRTADLGC